VPRVEITCSVDIPERPVTLVELEELAGEQARRLARQIIQRGIEASEPAVLEATPGARQRPRSRFVLTQFGEVRFARWKVRRPDGTYTYPLDAALGLEPHQTVSPTVMSTLTWLAATMPFKVAADVSSRLWGFTVNPKRIWRLTQKAGERIRDLFTQGLGGPPPDLPPGQARHEMVVVQADGTGLRCREGPTEAKIACWYADTTIVHDGRNPHGPRRRVFLDHKGVYASLQPAQQFGATAHKLCNRHLRIDAARYRLAVSDAGSWLPLMFRSTFDIPWHQLDHFHGRRRFTQTPGLPTHAAEHLWRWTLAGDHQAVDTEIQWRIDNGHISLDDATNLLGYLNAHRKKLWAAQALRRHGAPAHLCTRWSAPAEHTVDLLVARRMKKRGMHWSRKGAANMLALRTVLLNPGAWEEVFPA
jgi:hypothetical protein